MQIFTVLTLTHQKKSQPKVKKNLLLFPLSLQFDQRFSPIPMAAHRGSKDSRSLWEGTELLLGHLEVTAQVPPNTVKGPALSTLLTLQWREGPDRSGMRGVLTLE